MKKKKAVIAIMVVIAKGYEEGNIQRCNLKQNRDERLKLLKAKMESKKPPKRKDAPEGENNLVDSNNQVGDEGPPQKSAKTDAKEEPMNPEAEAKAEPMQTDSGAAEAEHMQTKVEAEPEQPKAEPEQTKVEAEPVQPKTKAEPEQTKVKAEPVQPKTKAEPMNIDEIEESQDGCSQVPMSFDECFADDVAAVSFHCRSLRAPVVVP